MARVLRILPACAAVLLAGPALADYEIGSGHTVGLSLRLDYVAASSDLTSWPSGGLSKLRYDADDSLEASSVAIDYSGRIKPTLWAHVLADFVADGSEGLDIIEAFVAWRPVPDSANRHQLRAGAMYPPFSYENTASGWMSPYSVSFSAINTWLGEEIRPFGLEWSMTRRVGDAASPHQINVFAAAFYGNDPAATLLFWRGWSSHDRQTRFDDRLPIPAFPMRNGADVEYLEQSVAPFEEVDSSPGFYAGLEWRFANRIRAQLGAWDNRADPYAFDNEQWGWDTRFWNASLQVSLPWNIGLISQWMRGDTGWLPLPSGQPDATVPADTAVVVDEFESAFVLLTRRFSGRHQATLRYEEFSIRRPGSAFFAETDAGRIWTAAYRFEARQRFDIALEWLEISSQRDLWSRVYAAPRSATERMLRVQLAIDLSL